MTVIPDSSISAMDRRLEKNKVGYKDKVIGGKNLAE